MVLTIFFKAVAAGAALAAPIGPMALLCVRRTIGYGWRAGFVTGAGIASGDMLLSIIPAAGMAGVSAMLLSHERLMRLAAGPVLIYLGARALFDRGEAAERGAPFGSFTNAYATSTMLTLANPPTLITFAALFALIAPAPSARIPGAVATIAGIGTGSLLWWIALVSIVASARRSVTLSLRRCISGIAGLALAAFGILQMVHK